MSHNIFFPSRLFFFFTNNTFPFKYLVLFDPFLFDLSPSAHSHQISLCPMNFHTVVQKFLPHLCSFLVEWTHLREYSYNSLLLALHNSRCHIKSFDKFYNKNLIYLNPSCPRSNQHINICWFCCCCCSFFLLEAGGRLFGLMVCVLLWCKYNSYYSTEGLMESIQNGQELFQSILTSSESCFF